MCFTIFQNEKTLLQAIRTRISKSRKIESFPKGLVHGFDPKLASFPSFYFTQYRAEKCVLRYSIRRKHLCRLEKHKVKKVEKLRFLQWGQSMLLVQNWPFFYLFLFQAAIRTRISKSRKIESFPKGLVHGFDPKLQPRPQGFSLKNEVAKIGHFSIFLFQSLEGRKMCFRIFQKEKTPLQAIKTRSSKSGKIDIFPNGLAMVLVQKWPFFKLFV